MIIDSHAHYAHPRFNVQAPCLDLQDGEYLVNRYSKHELLSALEGKGIVGVIEPSISFDNIENQISLANKYKGKMWLSIGVHPTRCINTKWKNRKKLMEYARGENVVAIGETGLDYHYPRKKQKRFFQKKWFVYQLKLAKKLKLPLILHVREADRDALKILKKHKDCLFGGVAHCFTKDTNVAKEYISLGFKIGIGGKILNEDIDGFTLCETVKSVPLSSILVETDSPLVLPNEVNEISKGNQRKKLCNSSLILPKVIRKIAIARQESIKDVEDEIYRNTVTTFKLNPIFQ